MRNYVLSPSILAADFKVLGQEMKKTEENGAAYIHFEHYGWNVCTKYIIWYAGSGINP